MNMPKRSIYSWTGAEQNYVGKGNKLGTKINTGDVEGGNAKNETLQLQDPSNF